MPLRDHFRPPLDRETSWDGLHGGWPMMIVDGLDRVLPRGFVSAPHVHLGTSVEVDVATFEGDDADRPTIPDSGGGVATAAWAPPRPTSTVATDLPSQDEYEVRVFDARRGRRLVAAVEIVSPANKDRPENRRAFVAKCVAMLRQRVCVAIVDLVAIRSGNLAADLIDLTGQAEAATTDAQPPLYVASCRLAPAGGAWSIESWAYPLELGRPLPTLPLWLAEDLAVPLELERSYEETCRILRIP